MTPHFDALIYAAAFGVASLLMHGLDEQPWFVQLPALAVLVAIGAHFLLDLWSSPTVETWTSVLLGLLLFWGVSTLHFVATHHGGHHGHA